MVRPERAGPPQGAVPAAARRRCRNDYRQPEPRAGQPCLLPDRRASGQIAAARLRPCRVPPGDRQWRDGRMRTGACEVSGRRAGAATIALIAIGAAGMLSAQGRRAELDGVWILAGNARIDMTLTPAGEAARGRYNYLKDDPAMRCVPASFTRVMHTPSPPIEVRQHAGGVEINYEFMDVHRRVPLTPGLAVKDAPYAVKEHPHLGRSVGRYDGDVLVIDTAGQHAGILDTLGAPGLVQSDQMRTSGAQRSASAPTATARPPPPRITIRSITPIRWWSPSPIRSCPAERSAPGIARLKRPTTTSSFRSRTDLAGIDRLTRYRTLRTRGTMPSEG